MYLCDGHACRMSCCGLFHKRQFFEFVQFVTVAVSIVFNKAFDQQFDEV